MCYSWKICSLFRRQDGLLAAKLAFINWDGVCIWIKVDRKLDKIDLHLVKINFKILVHTATQKKWLEIIVAWIFSSWEQYSVLFVQCIAVFIIWFVYFMPSSQKPHLGFLTTVAALWSAYLICCDLNVAFGFEKCNSNFILINFN